MSIIVLPLFILSSCGSSSERILEDTDRDGIWDVDDTYPGDTDNDGQSNEIDNDDDGDGYDDAVDAFGLDPTEYLDTDGDGIGNNSDEDDDGDGILDQYDVFPLTPGEWEDTDSDGSGNNTDPDNDNDGISDEFDLFPDDSAKAGDPDGDGVDSLIDLDDDNDGYTDAVELDEGSNQFDVSSRPADADSDGLTDMQESGFGSNPDVSDTDSDGLDDRIEFYLRTLPVSGDTDGDGFGDADEAGADFDHAPDFDRDGIIDALDYYLVFDFRTDDGSEVLHDRFGISTDPSGNIYVLNFLDDSIQKFDATGNPIREIHADFSNPNDVTVTATAIYVTDTTNNRILRLTPSGEIAQIFEHQPDGTPGGFVSPRGVDADANGNIYVADTWNDRIQKYDANAGVWFAAGSAGAGSGQMTNPVDIAAGPAGTIAVADHGNFRIDLFDSNLNFAGEIDGSSLGLAPFDFRPKSLSYAPDGRLYVLDEAHSRVVVIDAEGNLVGTFGSAGSGRNEFRNPTAVHVDANGKVYVSDRTRVQEF